MLNNKQKANTMDQGSKIKLFLMFGCDKKCRNAASFAAA